MEYNFYKIGDRLQQLRKQAGYSQEKLIEILGDMDIKVCRNTISKMENGTCSSDSFNLRLLAALAQLYDCEVGYLLCEYDCKTGRNTDIKAVTGLNDESIQALEKIHKRDINENTDKITLFPTEIFEKIKNDTPLTEKESAVVQEILFDDTGKYIQETPKPQKRPLLMDMLNFLFAHKGIERITALFRNYIQACYNVPVYFDNDKNTFVYPNNDYSYLPGLYENSKGNYILNFASSQDNPSDHVPVYLNESFFDTVTLKDMEKELNSLRNIYKETHK